MIDNIGPSIILMSIFYRTYSKYIANVSKVILAIQNFHCHQNTISNHCTKKEHQSIKVSIAHVPSNNTDFEFN